MNYLDFWINLFEPSAKLVDPKKFSVCEGTRYKEKVGPFEPK
jgi:hypothetical protein